MGIGEPDLPTGPFGSARIGIVLAQSFRLQRLLTSNTEVVVGSRRIKMDQEASARAVADRQKDKGMGSADRLEEKKGAVCNQTIGMHSAGTGYIVEDRPVVHHQ